MAAESSTQDHDPTLVKRLLDQQRDGWRRGERVAVEVLLEGHPTLAEAREGLLDLVWNEVELRAARGETPQLDEYQRRFPTLSDELHRRWKSAQTLGLNAHSADATLEGDSGAPVIPSPTAPVLPAIAGYEIRGELGKGGMGVVYEAWQPSLNRVVALKMILAGPYADPEEVARFQIEARAVASLQHPHIVQIHEVGECEGRPYLSLEFCGGGSLAQKLSGAPLPAREAAALVETLARTMHAVHLRKIIHRDLKPANVLLTEDGTPKITDFGLAKKLDDVGRTATGAVLGTPSYMAPEQAGGKSKEIGPGTDVYALGAILYECLTGRPPFKATTALETLMQVQNDDPAPPRRLQLRTPRDLETICLKCLEKQPEKRYGSAAALAEDLRRYQGGVPIAARPVGRVERTWRWCRRNPKDVALIAAGLLAVVLGVFAYLWLAGNPARNPNPDADKGKSSPVIGETLPKTIADPNPDADKGKPPPAAEMSPQEVTALARPSAAVIKNRFSTGSGFLVEGGHVVTSSNAIRMDTLAGQVVTFPSSDFKDRQYKVRLAYEDRTRDLAILLLQDPPTLKPLRLSTAALAYEERVLAIGSPAASGIAGGLSINSADKGTLLNPDFYSREFSNGKDLRYIVHSAKINPGCSGGPLLDTHGEVIGVNVMKYVIQGPIFGMTLAIPVDDVRDALAKAKARNAAEIDHATVTHDACSVAANLENSITLYHKAALFCLTAAVEATKQNMDPVAAYNAAKEAVADGQTELTDPVKNRKAVIDPLWPDVADLLAAPSLDATVGNQLGDLRDMYLTIKGLYEAPTGRLNDRAKQLIKIEDDFPQLKEALDAALGSVF